MIHVKSASGDTNGLSSSSIVGVSSIFNSLTVVYTIIIHHTTRLPHTDGSYHVEFINQNYKNKIPIPDYISFVSLIYASNISPVHIQEFINYRMYKIIEMSLLK